MKYEFKGTPAPWVVDSTPKGKLKVVCNNGFLIAMMYSGNPSDKDVHLIASAPDLLQACIDCLNLINNLDKSGEPISFKDFINADEQLNQAIHKALNITE